MSPSGSFVVAADLRPADVCFVVGVASRWNFPRFQHPRASVTYGGVDRGFRRG